MSSRGKTPRKETGSTSPSEPTLRLDREGWESWLAQHHEGATGASLLLTKRGAPPPLLVYADALEVALTWGWIDGQKRARDEHTWVQRFTPRRARSGWSKINCAKVEALAKAGKMHPPGLREMEKAKEDGRWARAYDSARTSEVPSDLATALAAQPTARAHFARLDGANRYAVLYRVQTAIKPETRAARIEKLVAMLARGEVLHAPRTAQSPTASAGKSNPTASAGKSKNSGAKKKPHENARAK